MTIRALYLTVGVAWGVILGGLAGLATFVFAVGVSWLYIFGDDSWPEATNRALPAFAIFAGFMIFAMCVAAGWYCGRRAGSPAANRRRARRTGFGLLGLWAATCVAIVAMSWVGIERQVADQEQGEAREAAFARLSEDRHTIDRIDFFGWNANAGSTGIVMRGNRNGDYQVSWQVTEPTYGQVLAAGRKTVSLGPGRRTVVIGIERDVLITVYRETVLEGTGGVKVDEAFRFAATVEPVLSAEESAALPPREIQNLAIGRSPLRNDAGVDVPISFQLPAAPAIQTD